jgi:hypothetical protein
MAAGQPGDTLLAKHSTFLDLTDSDDCTTLHDLLDEADAVVCGYRPGSLHRFGLGPDELAERHPGLVAAYLSAWGHTGPWSARRGFDSIVQAACGIAVTESPDGSRPGALPCQLLDHGTGYLLAASILDGLRGQMTQGGTHVRRLSLARTAGWLTAAASESGSRVATASAGRGPSDAWNTQLESTAGAIEAVTPPGTLDGKTLQWPNPCTGYGADPTRWQKR